MQGRMMMFEDGCRKITDRWARQYGIWYLLFLLLLLPVLLACQPQPQTQVKQPPDEVKLQLKWIHQAQFAGFYLAQEKGYYKAENINVTFMEGGPDVDIVQRLISGQADFAVIAPETVFMVHNKGESLVAIAAIQRRSPVIYVARESSGIVRPKDFQGKTVATLDASGSQKDMEIQFYAMMKKLGLDISSVKIVPWDSTYAGFYNGEVDVTPCYSTSALIKMRQKGMKPNLIWPSDYGVHFYSDLLVTTNKVIDSNPALVTRFLRASLTGWQDTIEDYQQAADVSMKYSSNKDIKFHTAQIEAMLPLINTGEDRTGWMQQAKWQGMYGILLEQGLLVKPFSVQEVYTIRFLEEAYGGKAK
jgi:NitT/TauT family transport system substrate-binding protein